MPGALFIPRRILQMQDVDLPTPVDGSVLVWDDATGKFIDNEPLRDIANGGGPTNNYLNILDFGAVGDGVANDSDPIQDALDAAEVSTSTRTVYAPGGTYKCNIDIPRGVKFIGAGSEVSGIWQGTAVPLTKLTPNNNAIPVVSVTVVTDQRLADFAIVGNGRAVTNIGLSLDNGLNYPGSMLVAERLFITGCAFGLNNRGATDTTWDTCTIVQCTNHVFFVQAVDGAASDTAVFRNCIVGGDGQTDATQWYFDGSKGIVIIGGDHNECGTLLSAIGSSITWIGGNSELMAAPNGYMVFADGSAIQFIGFRLTAQSNPSSVFIRSKGSNVRLDNCAFSDFSLTFPGNKGTIIADHHGIGGVEMSDYFAPSYVKRVYSAADFSAIGYYEDLRPFEEGFPPSHRVLLEDEFPGPSELPWTLALVSGSGSISLTNVFGAAGVVQVATDASSGSAVRYHLNEGFGFTADRNFGSDAPWSMEWRFKLSALTSVEMRIGWLGNDATIDPADAIYLRFSSTAGDTNFIGVCKNGGAATTVNTGVAAVADTWFTVQICSFITGTVAFVINRATAATVTATITGNYLTPGVSLKTTSAAQRIVSLDRFSLQMITPR